MGLKYWYGLLKLRNKDNTEGPDILISRDAIDLFKVKIKMLS